MAILSANVRLPIYELESSGGSSFDIVTLSAPDVPDPLALAEHVRTFLEGLSGVGGVTLKKIEQAETVI